MPETDAPISSPSGALARERKWVHELAAETSRLQATARYRAWLNATARHWNYSPLNCALIHVQRRDATFVAGRAAWARRGRTVRADATPITVLAPGGRNRFVFVNVFDLGDTEGPTFGVDDWTLRGGSRHLDAVVRAAGLLGITLRERASLLGASGVALPGRVVEFAAGLSRAEKTATLVHEYGHALLGHADGKARPLRIAEAEAEGVAFVVAKALGLRSRAPAYLACMGVSEEDLHASCRRIATTARDILAAIRGRKPRRRAPSVEEKAEAAREPLVQMLMGR